MRSFVIIVVLLVATTVLVGCGGTSMIPASSTANPPPTANPATIAAISPNSSQQGGPAFTLSVIGSNFQSGAAVRLNDIALQTKFVSPVLVTAGVPTSAITAPGPDAITVVNSPLGLSSNSLNLAVPCVIAPPAPASTQTRARLGAYYFDGWSGPLTNFHFNGLPFGPYQDRQPLSGWQDNNACAVEQQLALAHNFGIDFFVFDWYFNVQANDPGENLNSALQITQALPNKHGMQYAILYVDGPPFDVGPADWSSAMNEWVGYMKDPDYVHVNGKPAFFVINVGEMRQIFGSPTAVAGALQQLRAAAQAQGLPGVYIVGGFGPPDGTAGQESLNDGFSTAQSDGYDAVAFYGYPFAPPAVKGELPFSTLSGAGHWTWDQAQLHSALPFIPTAMSGWDPRPWNEVEPNSGDLLWYSRTPQDVAAFINDEITWAESNPQFRVEPAPAPPMVLIEAWNEFGEGSYILPTAGEGTTYGDALGTMLEIPSARVESMLSLGETGPFAPNRTAAGILTETNGTPVAAAPIALTATPVDGPGMYHQYQLSGKAPAAATQAIVGFRVNSEGAGPGVSDISAYQLSYVQAGDGMERVVNSDFSLGAQSWAHDGQTQFVASDRGAGRMVQVLSTSSQNARLDSAPFSLMGGDTFQTTVSARISPASVGSGYFVIIFLTAGNEISRQIMPFATAKFLLGASRTDAAGRYQFGITSLGSSHVILEATYAGDTKHWPAYARVAP